MLRCAKSVLRVALVRSGMGLGGWRPAMRALGAALAFLVLAAGSTLSATPGSVGLRVGAAKVEITPSKAEWPKSVSGVLDPIFVRAIVVDDGQTRAALLTVDTIILPEAVWSDVSAQIEREFAIPRDQILLTATHTHSAFPQGPGLERAIRDAVRSAIGHARPARMAYGTGVSYININRNMIDPATHRWTEGPNYDGPSDKTVAVVRFEALSGEPIAIYYNYAVHGVITGTLDQISGDIPGATSRYIEGALGKDVVAVWSTGASGDQNPVFFQQTYDLRQIRIDDYARRGIDIRNSLPPGGERLDRADPRVANLLGEQRQMVLSMGQMLGEEVLHVSRTGLERPLDSAKIQGGQDTVTCPGRRRVDTVGRAGFAGTYVDGDPVTIRLSLLRIGDTVIGGVNAEVFSLIGQRFKRESPYKHTMIATLTNGLANSGYIPNDAAFGFNTFEVVSSSLKPGCAESAIVDGLAKLVSKTEMPPATK